jgi:hypothetical protein
MPATILRRVTEDRDSSYASSSEDSARGSGASSFDPVLQTAHWLTIFLILGVFATAFLMHRLPIAWTLTIQLHRSLGITVWLVTVLRLGLASVRPLSRLAGKHVKSDATGGPGDGIRSLWPSAFATHPGIAAFELTVPASRCSFYFDYRRSWSGTMISQKSS